MKRFKSLILLMMLGALALAALAQDYREPFYPHYWISGNVLDAEDGTGGNGREIYLYKTEEEYSTGRYAADVVGEKRYMLNVFGLGIGTLEVGGTYYLVIPNSNPDNPAEGYGAGPVRVTISGSGADEAPDLRLAKGASPLPPPPPPGKEFAPTIKIWFGRRQYQPGIYGIRAEKKRLFVVQPKGTIKIEVDIPDPFKIDESVSYAMQVLTPLEGTKAFDLHRVYPLRATAAGVKPLIIETGYPEDLAVIGDESVYTFTFFARSRGDIGMPTSVSTQAAVTVMGGPTALVDAPLTYPSPISLRTDREVYLQYTLSRDAAIDIYLFDISARVVKKLSFNAGEEGGAAGLNRAAWDLVTDLGGRIGAGIYLFNIVEKESGRLLGKGKLTAIP
jgi:hypothetical protein